MANGVVIAAIGFYSPPCRPSRDDFEYSPSGLERAWTDQKAQGRLCSIARAQAQTADVAAWLNYSSSTKGPAQRSPTPSEQAALSSLRCHGGRLEYLEPLNGIARHPHASLCAKWPVEDPHASSTSHPPLSRAFDISYLVLQNACNDGARQQRHAKTEHTAGSSALAGRNLFFDLGASASSGKIELDRGSGLGPSVPLFDALYERNCIVFEQIYAWEFKHLEPSAYWDGVPLAMCASATCEPGASAHSIAMP